MRHLLALMISLLALATSAQSLVPEQISEQIDTSVTETAEQALEDSVSDSVDNTVTETVEFGVADSVNETVENSVAQSVTDLVTDTVGDELSQTVGSTVQETVQSGVAGSVRDTVQAVISESVIDNVGNAVADPLNSIGTPVAQTDGAPPDEIAVDEQWRAVAQEWLLLVDNTELSKLSGKVQLLETQALDNLGMTLVRLRTDPEQNSYEKVKALLPNAISVDRNHIYEFEPQTGASPPRSQQSPVYSAEPLSYRDALCSDTVASGVVDTAVNLQHPALRGATITQTDFHAATAQASVDHGSSVAGILVGQGAVNGLVPNARLAVAAVMFEREDKSQGATALNLVQALNWLIEQDVGVINMSLAGPPNRILETALARVQAKNITIVAAVGNAGPAAPALYPAAYPQVIGVTAVDGKSQVYRWANQGEHRV